MIAVHVAENRPNADAAARQFVDAAAAAGLTLAGCEQTDGDRLGLPVASGNADVVVAVGGDGTVLQGAVHALAMGAAIVGINVGRVGFLAEVEVTEIERLATMLATEAPRASPRMTLAATLGGTTTIGLNDVVIEKTSSQHMVGVDVAVDEERFLTYRCDGVIVTTPTGSSAYNLSAGGPLIDTRLSAMAITPVAPYSLFSAAVVIAPESVVVCEVMHSRPAGVSVDGRRVGELAPGEQVTITRGPDVNMIDFSARSYPETLKKKLRLHEGLEGVLSWGGNA
jgi:NAD+ kinase